MSFFSRRSTGRLTPTRKLVKKGSSLRDLRPLTERVSSCEPNGAKFVSVSDSVKAKIRTYKGNVDVSMTALKLNVLVLWFYRFRLSWKKFLE